MCGATLGRQSKSIDVVKQRCGRCKGTLRLLGAFNRDGTQAKPREPNGFAKYVKVHYAALKARQPSLSQKELMAQLGQQFRREKSAEEAEAATELCQEVDSPSAESAELDGALAALRL